MLNYRATREESTPRKMPVAALRPCQGMVPQSLFRRLLINPRCPLHIDGHYSSESYTHLYTEPTHSSLLPYQHGIYKACSDVLLQKHSLPINLLPTSIAKKPRATCSDPTYTKPYQPYQAIPYHHHTHGSQGIQLSGHHHDTTQLTLPTTLEEVNQGRPSSTSVGSMGRDGYS